MGWGHVEMERKVSARSMVVAVKEQVSCDLAGEVAILDLRSGVYYGLDAVGARIWSLLQEPRTVADVQDAILEEYDVEPDRCEHDLFVLLQKLLAEGLVEVRDAADG
jgi:hypothetical protein